MRSKWFLEARLEASSQPSFYLATICGASLQRPTRCSCTSLICRSLFRTVLEGTTSENRSSSPTFRSYLPLRRKNLAPTQRLRFYTLVVPDQPILGHQIQVPSVIFRHGVLTRDRFQCPKPVV